MSLASKSSATNQDYYIASNTDDSDPRVYLSKIEHDRLLASKNTLTASFAIEETFDLLSSNFLELEKDALSLSADLMLRPTFDHGIAFRIRAQINRRVINLLSSARLYLDQLKRNVRTCTSNTDTQDTITDKLRSHEFDRNFDYRFGEALRNHVQHNGLAVHSVNFPIKYVHMEVDDNNSLGMEINLKLFANKKILSTDNRFRSSTLAELPEEIELRQTLRSYMGSLNIIHAKVRELIDPPTSSSRAFIKKFHNKYQKLSGTKVNSFRTFQANSDDESTFISLEWDEIRRELREKNETTSNLAIRFVTARP